MTYTTMTTVSSGDTYAVARWNLQVKGNVEHLRARQNVGVYALTGAVQTITATSWGSGDTITFAEVTDLGGNYSSNTFTAPVAGFYAFRVRWWAQSATTSEAVFYPYLACSTAGNVPLPEVPDTDSSGTRQTADIGGNRVPGVVADVDTYDPLTVGHTSIVYLVASETVTVDAIRPVAGINTELSAKELFISILGAA